MNFLKGVSRFLVLSLFLSASNSRAQNIPDTVEGILGFLGGCFEVTYRFVEDGPHDKSYSPIYEWIRSDHKEGKQIYEHIGQYPERDEAGNLVYDKAGNQKFVTQYHWREEWRPLEEGNWEQVVIGPFNDFRYSCEAKWQLNQFHCHTDRASKPRRDRNRDYEYMMRINNLQLNGDTWIHNQRNKKFSADGSLVGIELGWNTYKRVDDSICAPAIEAHPMPLEP